MSFHLYLIALALGLVLGVAGLEYTPEGRINLLLIWLIWCGLPFIGSCFAGWMMFRRYQPPWIVRFAKLPGWEVDSQMHLRLWLKLHQLWCLVGIGILIAFLTLLVFTDLAFGWSSTLITDPQHIQMLIGVISFHWQAYWPAAVPGLELIEATRFVRISPDVRSISHAGDWWPFILASLLTYNLLPRVLLILVCSVQLRHASSTPSSWVEVSPSLSQESIKESIPDIDGLELVQQPATQWKDARMIYWETPSTTAKALELGQGDWAEEQQQWQLVVKSRPERIVWHVDVRRPPIAELADKMNMAKEFQIQQALRVIEPEGDIPAHLRQSWQAFAKRHQLIWLS